MIYAGTGYAGGETAVLRLRRTEGARAGDLVYRLTDAEQMAGGGDDRTDRCRRTCSCGPCPGPLTLTASDGESYVTVTGETVQAADPGRQRRKNCGPGPDRGHGVCSPGGEGGNRRRVCARYRR